MWKDRFLVKLGECVAASHKRAPDITFYKTARQVGCFTTLSKLMVVLNLTDFNLPYLWVALLEDRLAGAGGEAIRKMVRHLLDNAGCSTWREQPHPSQVDMGFNGCDCHPH